MRLRSLLLRWVLVPTLALWALGSAVGYKRSLDQANEAYDRTLLGSALVMAERLTLVDGDIVADVPHAALEMLRTDAQDRIFYRVADLRSGSAITGYEDLPVPPEAPLVSAPPAAPAFYDATYLGQQIRVVAVTHVLPTAAGPRRLLVQVAETFDARHQLTRRIATESAVVQLLLIALAAGLIAFGVQRGLAPLAHLRAAVQQRDPDDLTPVDTRSVPREVAPLIEAINAHTERQRQLSEAQARFVANASHQLKTPLTILRAQIGHALLQNDLSTMREVVSGMNASTEATGRLIEQLLALARSEPGRALARQEIDLTELARDTSFDLLHAARSKHIDLGFEAADAVPVRGERVLMRELVVNLVHNAVAYTPPGGTVTVSVGRQGGRAALRVLDNGPGIPAAERDKAFERFYRLPASTAPGSGLGLAIVKEICARHGITVTLADPPDGGHGLCVDLVWPIDDMPASPASPAGMPAATTA